MDVLAKLAESSSPIDAVKIAAVMGRDDTAEIQALLDECEGLGYVRVASHTRDLSSVPEYVLRGEGRRALS